MNNYEKIQGLLVGIAVGDAIGLPAEGMKPGVIQKLGWVNPLKHRLLFGRGMWSDDTEHTIILSQALLAAEGDVEVFRRKFAWELRWWLWGLPAGVGLATARAMFKLWLGFSPKRSGVFSAGNGAAMRTAVIAAYFPEDEKLRREFAEAHTRITHSDPKAATSSVAVTELAALLLHAESPPQQDEIISILKASPNSNDIDWSHIIESLQKAWNDELSLQDFLTSIGGNPRRGISGYAYHTVPAAIFLGFQYDWDYEQVVTAIIAAGGDTDTTAAIAGALCGAYGGIDSIPAHWQKGISEWPVNMQHISKLAQAVVERRPMRVRRHWSPALLLRNIFFLMIVLIHGFLRLVPAGVRSSI